MSNMRAIVITQYGEPEVLEERPLPIPAATRDDVVLRVHAFGLNHAEAYFRRGIWGDVAKVTGIECAGEIHDPGATSLKRGQRAFALMGGMGRTMNGSYAQYVRVPSANVVPFESTAEWTLLAAIPESYATAWTFLRHNLDVTSGQVIVVRGGTSALGQAVINVARDMEIRVLATTRSRERMAILEQIGAEPLIDRPDLSTEVRRRVPAGVDGVIDVVGTSTLLDSFKMVR
jgi:NADPH:quinone reductase-like Zn-dependent oxidoreductase